MDVHKDRAQVLTLDVVDTGRRRRWSVAEKVRITEESFSGPRMVSATARRHGVSRSLLSAWRRLHRQGLLPGAETASPGFAAVRLASEPSAERSVTDQDDGRVEIVLRNSRRLVIGAGMDASALAQLIAVVERA